MTAFIDTAVIMYAGGRDHPLRAPCQRILRAVVDGEIDAVTSAEVIQEILHRFSALREGELGAAMARNALDVFGPVVPVTHDVMTRMPQLVRDHPALTARDLVHVATCREEGIDTLVSPDRGFDEVGQPVRVDPADVDRLLDPGRR